MDLSKSDIVENIERFGIAKGYAQDSNGQDYYVIVDPFDCFHYIARMDHEQICNLIELKYKKHLEYIYHPTLSAAFLLDIRYRDCLLSVELLNDGRNYLLERVGEGNINALMNVINMFRTKRGIFNEGVFDTSSLSEEQLKELNPIIAWKAIQLCNNKIISMAADIAIELGSYKCHQAHLEKFIRYYRSNSSHLTQRKGPITKDKEIMLRYNAIQLSNHYQSSL